MRNNVIKILITRPSLGLFFSKHFTQINAILHGNLVSALLSQFIDEGPETQMVMKQYIHTSIQYITTSRRQDCDVM